MRYGVTDGCQLGKFTPLNLPVLKAFEWMITLEVGLRHFYSSIYWKPGEELLAAGACGEEQQINFLTGSDWND